MRQRLMFGLVVSVVSCVPAAAEGPAIQHQPLACAVAGRFPQLTASFTPADAVARARVQFQSESGRAWYGVAMKRAGAAFAAVLPKPTKRLKSYRYYIEVTDTSLGSSRTPEYTTVVGANGAACSNVKAAEGLASAAVKLEVPAGAPAAPGGFSTSGVIAAGAAGAAVAAGATAAAGGGISTAVLIGGGLAVAGAGVAVAASAGGGGDGGGGDSSTSYQGPFNGEFALITNFRSNTCSTTSALVGTAMISLDQTSGAVTGNFHTNGTETFISNTCQSPNGARPSAAWSAPLTGTAGALSARKQDGPNTSTGVAVVTTTTVYEFSGALSGGVIVGTMTITYSGDGRPEPGAGFPFTFGASTTIPVTLR